MKNLETLNKFWDRKVELEKVFDKAEAAEDQAGMDAARASYQDLLSEVREGGDDASSMMRFVSSMRERGNQYIDVDSPHDDPEDVDRMFRAYGVTSFVLDSSWTSAIEYAWKMQELGWKLSGMVEVNSKTQKFMSDEYEKVHGLFFSLN